MKLVYLASHPIQYHAPLFRALAKQCDFEAWFAHRQDAAGQAAAGYGTAFDWDVDLLTGYRHRFLHNTARNPSPGRFNGCNTPEVAQLLEQLRPHVLVVGGWNLRSYWQAIGAARRLRVPVFARSDSQRLPGDGRWRSLVRQLVHRPMLRRLDGFLAAGIRSSEYLRSAGIPERRIHIVPHTVDVARFGAGTAQRAETRDALGVGTRRVILYVGRLIKSKRVDMLIDALHGLPQAGVVLWIVGDGPERSVLHAQAEASGIAFRFLGFRNQSELPGLYAAADLLVLASEHETWGLVVNEALAAGCRVVVTTTVGCGPDLVAFAPAVTVAGLGPEGLRDCMIESLDRVDSDSTTEALAAAVASFSPNEAARQMIAACRRGSAVPP